MIKITCLLDGENGKVPGLFSDARYALVIDADTGRKLGEFSRGAMSDEEFALRISKDDPEAVITGQIEEKPFEILAERFGITRYDGAGYDAEEAVRLMNAYRLRIIPDFIGGTGCHSGGECHDHHEQ